MKIINNIFMEVKNIDKKLLFIVHNGLKCSFVIFLFGILFLAIYLSNNYIFNVFDIGFQIIKSSLMYICMFIICGIVFNKIIY